jgi:hypothetical protein
MIIAFLMSFGSDPPPGTAVVQGSAGVGNPRIGEPLHAAFHGKFSLSVLGAKCHSTV